MRAAVLLLFAFGCSDGGNGTAVGNPGHLDVYVQDVPEGVALSEALFKVAAIELVGCDRDVAILQLDTTFDALGPSPVDMPAGEWCSTVVLPDGADSFLLEGTNTEGETFMFSLSPAPFVLDGAYTIDGNQVVVGLSLADRVSDVANEAEAGAPDSVPAGQFGDDELFQPELVVPGGLFLDEDRDGRGEEGSLVAAPTSASADCGCSSVSAPSAGIIALAGMLGWRRRRRHPPRLA
ncbi:MAG: MYXO-CTERM sorting domain-containing protein [Myxococcota bacterium]